MKQNFKYTKNTMVNVDIEVSGYRSQLAPETAVVCEISQQGTTGAPVIKVTPVAHPSLSNADKLGSHVLWNSQLAYVATPTSSPSKSPMAKYANNRKQLKVKVKEVAYEQSQNYVFTRTLAKGTLQLEDFCSAEKLGVTQALQLQLKGTVDGVLALQLKTSETLDGSISLTDPSSAASGIDAQSVGSASSSPRLDSSAVVIVSETEKNPVISKSSDEVLTEDSSVKGDGNNPEGEPSARRSLDAALIVADLDSPVAEPEPDTEAAATESEQTDIPSERKILETNEEADDRVSVEETKVTTISQPLKVEPEAVEDVEPEAVEDAELEAVENTEPEAVEDTEPEAVEDTEPGVALAAGPEAAEEAVPQIEVKDVPPVKSVNIEQDEPKAHSREGPDSLKDELASSAEVTLPQPEPAESGVPLTDIYEPVSKKVKVDSPAEEAPTKQDALQVAVSWSKDPILVETCSSKPPSKRSSMEQPRRSLSKETSRSSFEQLAASSSAAAALEPTMSSQSEQKPRKSTTTRKSSGLVKMAVVSCASVLAWRTARSIDVKPEAETADPATLVPSPPPAPVNPIVRLIETFLPNIANRVLAK